MDAVAVIPCVIYAAKSIEDKRGSIPDQLRECREAIEADPLREQVAEYKDEAVSAYRRDPGSGLGRRHSTRRGSRGRARCRRAVAPALRPHRARGGKAARHTVEIALWALKNDVRVRTLQDPDTFRDLLYPVITGQRNKEDSKRKALAAQAGTRRAAQRGEYTGHLPRPFDRDRVYAVLRNPRYAGLSLYGGEVMARGCWPAYISERQHERILAERPL